MASSQHVEVEAAKFLHKLIQESKDEPAKLATKLYVICQHMKMSGKEQSLPYQVISRAMETVITQHRLDIDVLRSSRLSLGSGSQTSEAKDGSFSRTTQNFMLSKDGKEPVGASEPGRVESLRQDIVNQGSISQSPRSGKSLERESSASVPMEDSKSGNSQEMQAGRKEVKKVNAKRKRADSKESSEILGDDSVQLDSASTRFNSWKGKQTGRVIAQSYLSVKGGEHSHASSIQQSAQMGQGSDARRQFKDVDERDTNPNPLPLPKTEKATRDIIGGATTSQPTASKMPFKEHHLKQLRAQCLVFLAFRNNVPPRKLHLEIALGEKYPKEGGSTDLKGKSTSLQEHGHYPESPGTMMETEFSSKDTDKKNQSKTAVEQRLPSSKQTTDISQLKTESRGPITSPVVSESLARANRSFSETKPSEDVCNRANQLGPWSNQQLPFSLRKTGVHAGSVSQIQHDPASVGGINTQEQPQPFCVGERTIRLTKPEFPILETNVAGDSSPSLFEAKSQVPHFTTKDIENLKSGMNPLKEANVEKLSSAAPEIVNRIDKSGIYHGNGINGLNGQRTPEIQKHSSADGLKTIIYSDVSRGGALGQVGERSTDHDEECSSMESVDAPLSPPKLTTSEKWIFEQQKRKREDEEKWTFKQRKAEEQIAACFEKLKENVNASEDISTRTKSVIELKKLQLLQVQRRLRRDFLSDFFKPISSRMEHLKSVKKHRHGRKIKQLERFEQKMKEERLKRIRERQKEFFGEIEAHKERLEDYFKIKRERCKGVNRYVKEFHKRKERIHREKIDRIQREKINLLKANDVEGYLRMVQDAKSDRVKQLLKETEKYLQKLGAKIKDAKSAARLFGGEVETSDVAMSEKSEVLMDPEDESDQAQHYLESNEKYYLMAHSVKETIEEQPVSLRGGKLREYQMNGLRWLVSLYNNHLNGILADEMGLGKTVQVISLICYLMETKNDRGPFLVVVPSSVLPGWETEINFWAPEINKIMYSGTPEERRRLFKERIAHQKFNVLLTTYEYLMNKHDRPKLSKIDWHYVIIDEGHRIKNASCKLNADLKHYRSNHRLLLTGTPLQNNLEELWALLNFLLPDIFNSAEDFSQWFNKPFQSNSDNSPDEALLSEEENLLIINRLHQVLRPFVLRRLKHKVENELPEKIERLIRCEASAYQKLLMKRVEDNLGSIGPSKGRSVHNTVMELRNICNHPYLSQLHSDEVDALLPKHYLPPLVRLCGKLEMVDRLLPKLKATGHRVLFFSTMTRLLDVMEEYLHWKHYRYLRLDGHTSGNDRGALIKEFNRPDSSTFIFLLSIRAGGVGVNLQAADTVMIFDTDWNPQVDLQAQARAHRIGQKRDVLVLRLETVNTVEEQVRAAAEHKLGVANQSITAGFFDNNTSAEDRREYLESLLRECKKEEAAPVLDDDALNYLLARSEAEIDVFESLDRQRREQEAATWQKFTRSRNADEQDPLPMPPRLVTDEDLEPLYKALRISEVSVVSLKRKGDINLDTQHYGRGKRAREVRSYEDQWTEEEFEKLCQADSPGFSSPKLDESLTKDSGSLPKADDSDGGGLASVERLSLPKDPQSTPVKRGRGRPKRSCEPSDHVISQENAASDPGVDDLERSNAESSMAKRKPSGTATTTSVSLSTSEPQAYVPPKGLSQKMQTGESSRGRAKKSSVQVSAASLGKTRVSKSSSDSQTGFELAAKTEESVSPQLIEQSSILPVSEKVEIIKDESAEKLKAEGSTTSVPALARHVSEKKNSVTSKKAAAREARTMSSSAQDVRSRSTGSKKRNPKPLRLKLTSDSDDKDAEKSSASHDSVVTLSNQKRESSSKSVSESCMLASPQRGNSDENPEILHQKASTFIGESFPKEKDSESSEKAVQDGCIGENIAEPPADQLTSETSLTVESSVEPVPGKSDHLNVSSQVHADGAVEMSVVDMHPTSSGIKDAIVTKDGSVVESGRDGLIVPLCPVLSVPRIDQESSRPVDPQPPHIESQDNKEDFDVSGSVSHSADALCDHDEDENVRHALHDNNQNYGALASAGSPEDSTCIKDGGNDINLSSQVKDQDLDASASVGHSAYAKCDHDEDDDARLASQDKNPKYGAFASAGKPEDDTCIKDGSNDTSLSSQVKDQDLDASASVDHSADATCNHDEDDDVRLASQDKNENYGAVASVGHSEDATCVKDDTSLSSQVKNQDCDASAPEGHSSDATCAKDEGNDASLESQDDNKVLNVSASESHSADATCDSGVRLASQDENRNCDAPAAVAHSADDTCETGVHLVSLCENRDYDEPASAHSADDTCIKEEGDDVGLVSQDEIQDHDASALDGHSAYDTCTVHEGNDVSVASPVKFQDHDASASYMHSADGACLASEAKNEHNDASVSAGHSADATHAQDQENEINVVSEDKVEDYGASISACQSADATCIKDVRNHIGHASPDEDHNSYASISERHSADATCTRDEGNDASLAPPDKSQDDPTASEGHSADATCANDVGNDVSLVSQDKNQDCNASVSGGHSADAMCIEENDVSLSSLDKNEDPDASASGSHSADATCVSYEGTDACTLSQDKNEDPTASTSEGHSADATSLSPEANDFNLSAQDKMQDPNASASEGHSADATCIKDEGYDGCILSQDKDQDLTASAGGGHSADATCISHEGNDVRLTSQDNNEIPDASGSEDHSADATCIKEEGDHASILFLDKKEDPNASASGGYSADATSSNPEGNDVSLQDPHASASMGHSADATWASHASDEVSLPSQDQSADPDATASGDHSADASHEGNEDSLPLRDQNEDPDASASGAQSADATCAGREGNEDSLPLQDQNEDPDASASGGQLADATCAGRESNGDSLPLRDENEDPYASADATCASHEGNEVTLPLQDKNEDADVSGSGGQSADAMCHNHEGDDPSILSRVKNQDPTASASEGHSADATCTEDADPSASEGHSADARGIKDEDNDIDSVKSLPQGQASDPSECAKNAEKDPRGITADVSTAPSPPAAQDEHAHTPDEPKLDVSLLRADVHLPSSSSSSPPEQPIAGVTGPASPLEEEDQMPPHASEGASSG